MSRIRSIKPELLEDERIASLPHGVFRLFVAVILLADDYGNFRAEPRQLFGRGFVSVEHCTPADVQGFRDQLAAAGLVHLYRVRGQTYGHVVNWDKHQYIAKKGAQRVPPPDADGAETMFVSVSETLSDLTEFVEINPTKSPRARALDQDLDLEHRKGKDPPPVEEKVTSEQRYAEAYAEGQREAAPGSVYRAPEEPWQRGAINTFTVTEGWGKGLRGDELTDAVRQVSRDYRRAMNDDAYHAKQGFPPKLCLKWAEGAEWKPRRKKPPRPPQERRSPAEPPPEAPTFVDASTALLDVSRLFEPKAVGK